MKEDKKDEYEIKKMVSLNLILILLQLINIGPHERHKLMFIKMTVLNSIKIILSFLYKKNRPVRFAPSRRRNCHPLTSGFPC